MQKQQKQSLAAVQSNHINNGKQSMPQSLPIQNNQNRSGNIFANLTNQSKSMNIFAKKPADESKKNIFASQSNNSVNLFSISTLPKPSNPNIFKTNSKPLISKSKEERQSDDQKSNGQSSSKATSSDIRKRQQQFKNVPQKKEMKYNYQNPWISLKSYNLRKFRNALEPVKEKIYLTIQKHKQSQNVICMMIRSQQTKVIQFDGILHKDISQKIETFMNKQENLKIKVLITKNNETKQQRESQQGQNNQPNQIRQGQVKTEKSKITFSQVRIQFLNSEDAEDFKKSLHQILNA